MKRWASILCVGFFLVAATAPLYSEETSNRAAEKVPGGAWTLPSGTPDTGGETIGTATIIPSLPYTDSGNTCGTSDDYTPTCATSSAGDLVYQFTPGANTNVCLSLCGSTYDTILYVFGPGLVEIACNDDHCGLQSQLNSVNLTAGTTYYFVIDGFSANCGAYTFNNVVGCVPPYACPPGSQIEGEPRCGPNYVDNYNGGCNSTPAVFSEVTCGYICGEMGTYTYNGLDSRDTDWYRLTVGPGYFLYNGGGENYPLRRYVLTAECPPTIIATTNVRFQPLPFTGPGSYYFFAGPDVFSGMNCGERYWISFEGPGIPPCGATVVAPGTWGSIKNAYR